MDYAAHAAELLLHGEPRTDAEYEEAVDRVLAELRRTLQRIEEDRLACDEMAAETRAAIERIKKI